MNETLATEMLKELKASAKRWFIIALVELVVIFSLIFIILVVPESETTATTQEVDDVQNIDTFTQSIGGE